jgi:hypothetical protein
VESFGNIPSDIIDNAMQMLKPVTNYVETYAAMWERILDEKSMEMRERRLAGHQVSQRLPRTVKSACAP